MTKRQQQSSSKRAQKNRRIGDVPMTPMIDVVFQLLIFFVFTFEIPHRVSEMRVNRVQSDQDPKPGLSSPTVHVGQAGDGVSPYFMMDRRIGMDRLKPYFFDLADSDATQTILVVASDDSVHEDLVRLLDLLSEAGLDTIALISSQ